jgi:hypothetical protein
MLPTVSSWTHILKTFHAGFGLFLPIIVKCKLTENFSHLNICRKTYTKNQLSRQTGSRNPTGPKTLPTIWHTYMKLVTKYRISAIDSCWENLLPVCRLCWFLYTLNIYAHFSSHFSQQILMAEIWYLVTSFI